MRLAVMQGRLLPPSDGHFQSFPLNRWREEFPLARQASLDAIEWIYDSLGESGNPIGTDVGLAEMMRLCEEDGIAVVSVCADYFMERPLLRVSPPELEAGMRKLVWLTEQCRLAGIERIVLPFVDNSRIENQGDEAQVIEILIRALKAAETAGIELHLETSLGPKEFASLLAKLPNPLLKVNYDSGNSASLGFDPEEEIAAYGERIGSVHIKDRIRGGGTVPLGSGNANIPVLLSHLFRIGYKGDFVMQVARAEPGGELDWIRMNRELVMTQLQAAGFVSGDGQ
ncbi:Xylose isomerase-like TIM barrel [Acidisarcina polymorpha]|uniref:Xylose isomerase-like TIM barrel n=1 Tax=Acidisarcina polymorpha TaxID=2211140 RepID=A0A2Z5FYN1_9BACT|nr:sugar phosphate isomerase/epimerase [Acidisarcina polymorpha]AXC11525.1 Xylose isomerase-like TIM barrel [Acidisarcina polymorpha]